MQWEVRSIIIGNEHSGRITSVLITKALIVTTQIRDVTGQRQTYTYASEALTY